jgi:hypothetical protein
VLYLKSDISAILYFDLPHLLYKLKQLTRFSKFFQNSIIFQPEMGEEFWYLLKLTTELPKPKEIPEMQCDLGK